MDASMTDTTFMVMPLGSFREKLSPRARAVVAATRMPTMPMDRL